MADTLTATPALGTDLATPASPASPSPSLSQSPSSTFASPASPAMSAASPPQSPVVPQSEYDLHYTHYFAHYSDYYANNSAAALAAASASSPGGIYTGSIESAAIAAAASAASYYANYYTKHARNENRAEPAPETQAAFSTTTNTLSTTTAASTQSAPASTQSVGSTTALADASATAAASSSAYYATAAANGSYATAAQADNTAATSNHTAAQTYAQAVANGAANAAVAQQQPSAASAYASSSVAPAVDDVSGTSKTINLATGEISTGTSHTAHQLATLQSPRTTPSITPSLAPTTNTASTTASTTTPPTATSTAYPYGYNPWAAYSAFYFGVSPSTSGTNAASALSSAASLTSEELAAKAGGASCESWYNQHYPGYCSCTNCSAASSYYASYYASLQSKYAAAAAASNSSVSSNGVKTEPAESQSSKPAASDTATANGNSTSACTATNLPYYWPFVPHPSSSASSSSASSSSTSSPTPAEVYAAWYAKYYQAMASSGPCTCTQCAATSDAVGSTTSHGSTVSADRSTSPSNHSKQFCPCSVCVATSVSSRPSQCECDTCERGTGNHHHHHSHHMYRNGHHMSDRLSSSASSTSAAMSFLLSPSQSPLIPLSRSLSDREQSLPNSARLHSTASSSIGSLLKKMNRRRTDSNTSDESDGDGGSSLLRSPPVLSPLLRPTNSPHLSPSLHGGVGSGVVGVGGVGGQQLLLAGFSPSFASLSPHISALAPSPPLSSMTFAAPFPRSPRMSHSHIRDVTGASAVGASISSSVSAFAAPSSTSTSTPSSTSFSFFSPATSSRSPKFGIYSSSLLNSPSTFSLPSPSLPSILTKDPLNLRKSPRLTAIKEERSDEHSHSHTGKDESRKDAGGHGGGVGNGKAGGGGDGGVNGYNTLNHFLAPHFRSPLNLSLNGGKGDADSGLNSPTFIILQAVEQENNAASGRKRKREEEEEDEDDDEDEDEEEEDISSRQLKSSHTASLMLSHTPPHSYSSSPRNGSSSLSIPLLTPLLASFGGTLDGDEEDDSAPSSPSGASATTATSDSGRPSAATDDSMLLQLTDTASSFSALNTLSTLGNGSSCHQCKSLRPVNQLMYCCNNKKRGSKVMQQRDTTKPSCRKKFCDVCLAKFYGQKPSSDDMIRSGTDSSWECPSCVGICTCAACRRRKDTSGGTVSAGKAKGGGGAKKKMVVEPAEPNEHKEQSAPTAAAATAPAAHINGHAATNGSTEASDTLSVPPAATAPLSPLTLSPRKGVHMEYAEGDESPAVIHIARDSIVLPSSYSPHLTPKAGNGSSQPMEVEPAKTE